MTHANWQRRDFLKAAGLGAAAMALSPAMRTARGADYPEIDKDSPRPNVLWISTEDISPTLSCYGDTYARTPNLDRLASQGVRYARAFAHAPVCAPARSGIITGMYPTSIGTTWMRCQGVPPVQARCFPEYLRAAGYYCTNNSKTDYQFASPPSAWDECSGQAHWRNRREKNQPFFAIFNLTMTHESSTRRFKPGQTFDHDPAKAPVMPYWPDTPLVRQNVACYYDRINELDAAAQKILDALEADGLADNTIIWFWGDHGWGLTRGKRWVYDSGLRVPLLVRVPEKLRRWAGAGNAATVAPGRVEEEMVSFIDYAPTMLSLAGVKIPPHMHGQAFLGPQKPAQPRQYVYAARDRMDETYDFIRAVRDKKFKLIRNYLPWLTRAQNINYMDQTPILQEMRRLFAEGKLKDGPRMQFFEPTKPVRELYDVEADPHEVRNLAGDPKYAEVVARMQKALDDWMKRIGDIGFIPECDFDEMKGGGQTAPPYVQPAGAAVTLACPTKGASIVYRVEARGAAGFEGPTGETGDASAAIVLPASAAKINGGGAKLAGDAITSYRGADTTLTWEVEVPQAGTYPVHVCQANIGASGSRFELTFGEAGRLEGTIRHTSSWNDYVYVTVGRVDLPRAGKYAVTLRPTKQVEGRLGNIKAVVLGAVPEQAAPAVKAAEPKGKGAKGGKADRKAGGGEAWLLYSRPVELQAGQTLQAKACRLGYKDSPTVAYRHGEPAGRAGESGDPEVFWRVRVDASGMLDRCRALRDFDGRWAEGADAFLAALSDKEAPVRYWAVQGLHQATLQDAALVARALPAVEPLLKDPSPSVRTAAGEAMCDWGKCERGLATLLEVVTGKTGMGACYAAWALWRLGEKARPILPQLEKARPDGGRYPADVLERVVARLKKG